MTCLVFCCDKKLHVALYYCFLGFSTTTNRFPDCLSSEFRCKSGFCIAKKYRCDKVEDCIDKSDEEDCPQGENVIKDPKNHSLLPIPTF